MSLLYFSLPSSWFLDDECRLPFSAYASLPSRVKRTSGKKLPRLMMIFDAARLHIMYAIKSSFSNNSLNLGILIMWLVYDVCSSWYCETVAAHECISIISCELIILMESLLQIWDFNLGQLRSHEESSPVELEFGGSDVYTVKSYGELLKEASSTKRRGVNVSGMNCSFANEDIIPFNVSFSPRAFIYL